MGFNQFIAQLKDRGQTMVEYVLLLGVVASLAAALFPKLAVLFNTDAPCNNRSTSIVCYYKARFQTGANFKYYVVRP